MNSAFINSATTTTRYDVVLPIEVVCYYLCRGSLADCLGRPLLLLLLALVLVLLLLLLLRFYHFDFKIADAALLVLLPH